MESRDRAIKGLMMSCSFLLPRARDDRPGRRTVEPDLVYRSPPEARLKHTISSWFESPESPRHTGRPQYKTASPACVSQKKTWGKIRSCRAADPCHASPANRWPALPHRPQQTKGAQWNMGERKVQRCFRQTLEAMRTPGIVSPSYHAGPASNRPTCKLVTGDGRG